MGHFGITICLEALNGSFNIGYNKVKIGKNDKLREQTSFVRCLTDSVNKQTNRSASDELNRKPRIIFIVEEESVIAMKD